MTSASFTESELTRSIAPLEQVNGVRGVCLTRRSTVLLNRMALPKERFDLISEIMEDVVSAYERQGRSVEEIILGFNGGNVVLLALKEYRLLILHRDPEDTDEVCIIGHNFLDDLDRIEHGMTAKQDTKQALSRSDVSISLPETWRNRALTDEQFLERQPEPLADPQPTAEVEEPNESHLTEEIPPPTEAPESVEPIPSQDEFDSASPLRPEPTSIEETPEPVIIEEAEDQNSWEDYRKSLTRVLGKVMSRQTVSLFLKHELKTKRAIYGSQPSPDQFREIGDALTARIPDRVKRERIRRELLDLSAPSEF